MPRPRLNPRPEAAAEAAAAPVAVLPVAGTTFPTGSTLLDLGHNGGWGRGRMVNIVGDSSSGKTLLAIEAAINFGGLHGAENIRYNETEAAFDRVYAYSLGLPPGVSFTGDDTENGHGSVTVEDFFEDLEKWLDAHPTGPSLYIVDSIDAMSDTQEMGNEELGKATMGRKAKMLSEFFRRKMKPLAKANCCLMLISQIRDKVGVTFGESQTRAGGHAMDFYASQIVWLYEAGKIVRTVSDVERTVGIRVRFKNKKNKLGPAFAEGEISIFFNYGVDDELSMVNWLKRNKYQGDLSYAFDAYPAALSRIRRARDTDRLAALRAELSAATHARWREIEEAMTPPLRKYAT
jgi:recombination protein RecA